MGPRRGNSLKPSIQPPPTSSPSRHVSALTRLVHLSESFPQTSFPSVSSIFPSPVPPLHRYLQNAKRSCWERGDGAYTRLDAQPFFREYSNVQQSSIPTTSTAISHPPANATQNPTSCVCFGHMAIHYPAFLGCHLDIRNLVKFGGSQVGFAIYGAYERDGTVTMEQMGCWHVKVCGLNV